MYCCTVVVVAVLVLVVNTPFTVDTCWALSARWRARRAGVTGSAKLLLLSIIVVRYHGFDFHRA